MRLQLIVLGVLRAVTAGRAAFADVTAGATTSIYADDDHTTVVTSTATAAADATAHLRVDAQYLVDVVSSASVDVVSQATGTIHDTRREASLGVTGTLGDTRVRAGYVYGTEHDWDAHSIALSIARDTLAHNLTIGVDLHAGRDAIAKVGDPRFHERQRSAGGEAYATYTASKHDLVSLTYGVTDVRGYQASPYRFVVVHDVRPMFERVPDARLRQLVALHWNHHVFDDSALRTYVRAYRDSWDVRSLTAQLEWITGVTRDLDLGAHVRGYAQRHARFYRARYDEEIAFMTSDRELSSFVDAFAGLTAQLRHELGEHALAVDLALDAFAFEFSEFPRLRSRTGVVATLGLSLAL